MAVTDVHGTQAPAVVGTEHVLADSSAAGSYELTVVLSNMAAGDVLELRIYKMTLTGGTAGAEGYLMVRLDGAPPADDKVAVSIPASTALADTGAIRATLKQTFGTGRNFQWAFEKVGA